MGKNNRKPPFRRNSRLPVDRRGGSFKRGKWQNAKHMNNDLDFSSDETVYRILCPVQKIGSVIGKGGDIIKGLREETHAKIKVGESIPGAEERVVIIFSSSTKISSNEIQENENPKNKSSENEDAENENPGNENPENENAENEKPENENPENEKPENENPENENVDDEKLENPENDDATEESLESMEPHCPAQHALLKVHERIAEDDGLSGGSPLEEGNEDDVVTARLLVPSNQVGCLLGKGGHVIEKLRTETGANIRILPEGHLPPCAMSTDELVQISGISAVAKKALYEVSTLLYKNPRPQMKNPIPDGGQGFHPHAAPMGRIPPQGNPMSQRNSGFRGPPPMPWGGEFPRYPPGDASAEFPMKILCPTENIRLVIGKGGSSVRQLEHETGAKIQVEKSMPEAEEHAILISSLDAPWNPISPTIEAILHLQVKTNLVSEKGVITTRLLVPSSKVGCLLGQGGHIINEMRRRSRADIRIMSKDGKPNYASADEELVQISGTLNVARDALTEIASRLRMRTLEGMEPGPVAPYHGFGRPENFPERRLPPPGMIGGRSSGAYEHTKGGGYEFESRNYPAQPALGPGFPNVNSSMQVKIPNNLVNSVLGVGRSNIAHIGQISGAKVKLRDPQAGSSDCIVEIQGSFEQMNTAQDLLQSYMTSSVQSFNPQQHDYHSSGVQNFNTHSQPQQSSYAASAVPNSNEQQHQSYYASSLQNLTTQQNQSPYGSALPSTNTQQHQSPFASAAQTYNAQPHQPHYAAAAQTYSAQQQPTSYASSALPSYNAYAQQQQTSYPSATTQNYSAQPQEQSSYPAVPQSYDGQQQQQQQQVSYQY